MLSVTPALPAFISGPGELRQTLHLLQLLPLLHVSRLRVFCSAEERESSGKSFALTWGRGRDGEAAVLLAEPGQPEVSEGGDT